MPEPRPKRVRAPGAEKFLPEKRSVRALRTAAAKCEGCPLFEAATQTVFGEGPAQARVMLVGERLDRASVYLKTR